MSKVIFGLIGLALALATFACKRSEPPVVKVDWVSKPHHLPKPPEMMLESGLATEWTEFWVACARYGECAGNATGNQLLITRNEGRMMIGGSEEIALGKFREISGRPLEKDEFEEIVTKLRHFYGLAKSEAAEAKPFNSFPAEECERESGAAQELRKMIHCQGGNDANRVSSSEDKSFHHAKFGGCQPSRGINSARRLSNLLRDARPSLFAVKLTYISRLV